MNGITEARVVAWQTLAESPPDQLAQQRQFATRLIVDSLGIEESRVPAISAWVTQYAQRVLKDYSLALEFSELVSSLVRCSWAYDQAQNGSLERSEAVRCFSEVLARITQAQTQLAEAFIVQYVGFLRAN